MQEKLEQYLALLLEANEVMNLTAIRTPGEIRVRHFEDSLKLLECQDFAGRRVLDLGSGAGFPGLPLKIAEPSVELVLLDGTGKKVEFLRRAATALGLSGVEFVHARAEEYAHTGARESFDIVTARGVTALPALCELALPLLRIGGRLLAMKSTGAETAPYALLGGERREDYTYRLSDGTIHTVIIIEKTTPTNMSYPRTWGQIKKKPLV